jgi:hypothetical protein
VGVFSSELDGPQEVKLEYFSATKYRANCQCSTPGLDSGVLQENETVPLVALGTETVPRLNRLDTGLRGTFKIRERYTAIAELQTFNILNSSAPLTYGRRLGSSIASLCPWRRLVFAVMNARTFKISGQFKFERRIAG